MSEAHKKPNPERRIQSQKEIASNKRAFFDYEILDTYEVGIQLKGTEISSLRVSGASLQESYIDVLKGELWLIGAHIKPYAHGSIYNHEETRNRKLLAHRKEIIKIQAAIQQKGLTCIPLILILKQGLAKVKIGIGRGKKLHDKRASIQERDEKKNIARAIKHFNAAS